MLKLTLHNLREILIALDQLANVLLCTIGLQTAWSDESLSSHAWRARAKPWGRILMPPIDWLFSWQKPDPAYVDETNRPITGHCRRAFLRERARAYLPKEYREEPRP